MRNLEKESWGRVLLTHLADNKTEDALRYIERGAYLDMADASGRRALDLAAAKGNNVLVKALLAKEADPTAVNEKTGNKAVFEATANQHWDTVAVMVEATKPPADDAERLADKAGYGVALVLALKSYQTEVALRLVKKGVDVSRYYAHTEDRPLHLAARAGYTELAVALLMACAAPDVKNTVGNTAFVEAAARSKWETLTAMADTITTLNEATGDDPREEAVWLAASKAAINGQVPTTGDTPLHLVARAAKTPATLSAVKALLKAGADLSLRARVHTYSVRGNCSVVEEAAARADFLMVGLIIETRPIGSEAERVADKEGYGLALLHALNSSDSRTEEALSLIRHGVSVSQYFTDTEDRPLHLAARAGDMELVPALLKAGANPTVKNKKGHIPILEVALASSSYISWERATERYWGVVSLMAETYLLLSVEDRASVSVQYAQVLIRAIEAGQTKAALSLINAGVPLTGDPSYANAKQALYAASEAGNSELVRKLLNAGAEATAKGADGRTAIEIANYKKHTVTEQVFLEPRAEEVFVTILQTREKRALLQKKITDAKIENPKNAQAAFDKFNAYFEKLLGYCDERLVAKDDRKKHALLNALFALKLAFDGIEHPALYNEGPVKTILLESVELLKDTARRTLYERVRGAEPTLVEYLEAIVLELKSEIVPAAAKPGAEASKPGSAGVAAIPSAPFLPSAAAVAGCGAASSGGGWGVSASAWDPVAEAAKKPASTSSGVGAAAGAGAGVSAAVGEDPSRVAARESSRVAARALTASGGVFASSTDAASSDPVSAAESGLPQARSGM